MLTGIVLITSLASQNGRSSDLALLNFACGILVTVVKSPAEATHDFQVRLLLCSIDDILALHLHSEVSTTARVLHLNDMRRGGGRLRTTWTLVLSGFSHNTWKFLSIAFIVSSA